MVRVISGAGNPIEAAYVDILAKPVPQADASEHLSATALRTDRDGACETELGTDRSYDVFAFAKGYLPQRQSIPVSTEDANLTLLLTPEAAYGISLIDADRNIEILLSQVDAAELISPRGSPACMAGASHEFLLGVDRMGLDPTQVAQRMARRELFVVEDGIGPDVEFVANVEGYDEIRIPLRAQDVETAFRSPSTFFAQPQSGYCAIHFSLRDTTGRAPEGPQYVIVRKTGSPEDNSRI